MGPREKGRGDRDWMHLALDMDQWRAVVNMEMNSWGSIKGGVFLD
jgi:hypothetical protein